MFNKKKILITGGTGSFGNAFLDYLLKYDCKINILSRDELKQHEMRIKYNSKKINFFLGDIRDKNQIQNALLGVDYIFHCYIETSSVLNFFQWKLRQILLELII